MNVHRTKKIRVVSVQSQKEKQTGAVTNVNFSFARVI